MTIKARKLPPLDYLRECFELGGVTGLVWKHRPESHFKAARTHKAINKTYAGKSAGRKTICGRGDHAYWSTRVGQFGTFLNHRIVFALCHGVYVPVDFQIDHIDHDGLNNSPKNLRVVSHSKNQQNRRGLQRNNTSGMRGVSFAHHAQWNGYSAWRAYINVNGKHIHLGYFTNLDDAITARLNAEAEHRGSLSC